MQQRFPFLRWPSILRLFAAAGLALVLAFALLAGAAPVAAEEAAGVSSAAAYTPAEMATLRSLWIGSLGPIPDDPSNAWDLDPRAVRLGFSIFYDKRFSANEALGCVSCHQPELGFQDGKTVAEGLERLTRRSMPLAGVAYNTWFFWDGRKDSLWSQATAPLLNPRELGLTREEVVARVAAYDREPYEAIFGALPALLSGEGAGGDANRVVANVGKALAAYVRTIEPGPSRFDRYAEAVLAGDRRRSSALLTVAEVRGLRLFIGRARCINCHAGPLLTNGDFHFSRVPQPDRKQDPGRGAGIALVKADPFSCTGAYSDASADQCTALRFLVTDTHDAMHAFKTPSLRNVAARPPYMHAGQFRTLAEVLRFYRDKTSGIPEMGHGDLSDADLGDLEAFLGTLTGPITSVGDAAGAN